MPQHKECFSDSFYTSSEWKKCREGYLKYRNGLCEDCLELGLITPAVEVHHIRKIEPSTINDPSITLNWTNLRALCKDHHVARHRKQRQYSVDQDGHVRFDD